MLLPLQLLNLLADGAIQYVLVYGLDLAQSSEQAGLVDSLTPAGSIDSTSASSGGVVAALAVRALASGQGSELGAPQYLIGCYANALGQSATVGGAMALQVAIAANQVALATQGGGVVAVQDLAATDTAAGTLDGRPVLHMRTTGQTSGQGTEVGLPRLRLPLRAITDAQSSTPGTATQITIGVYARETGLVSETGGVHTDGTLTARALAQATELGMGTNRLVIGATGVAESFTDGRLRIALFVTGATDAQSGETGPANIEKTSWWARQYAPLILELANQAATWSLFDLSSAIDIVQDGDDLCELTVIGSDAMLGVVCSDAEIAEIPATTEVEAAAQAAEVTVLPRS